MIPPRRQPQEHVPPPSINGTNVVQGLSQAGAPLGFACVCSKRRDATPPISLLQETSAARTQ
ncbi:hypothetical protein Taro_043798 [Colocasia esculenta]|uniref:Uncharacterized protein n=1 Tax=Colocasia esculenta TaxID=4460 RepID=A0A843WM03_COLES|nr:hypothetical protein [Colocasia esculenta]